MTLCSNQSNFGNGKKTLYNSDYNSKILYIVDVDKSWLKTFYEDELKSSIPLLEVALVCVVVIVIL